MTSPTSSTANHFAVTLVNQRDTPSIFEGRRYEVIRWLRKQSDTSGYEVYSTVKAEYFSAEDFFERFSLYMTRPSEKYQRVRGLVVEAIMKGASGGYVDPSQVNEELVDELAKKIMDAVQ